MQIALDVNEGQVINAEGYKGFQVDVYGDEDIGIRSTKNQTVFLHLLLKVGYKLTAVEYSGKTVMQPRGLLPGVHLALVGALGQ